jgi:hypothetical protein
MPAIAVAISDLRMVIKFFTIYNQLSARPRMVESDGLPIGADLDRLLHSP